MFHYIVPLIIVVLFGIGGAAYYVFSLAATPTPELRVGSTPGGVAICLTAELDQGVSAHPCNGAVDQRWSATGGTIRNTAISGGPWCIAGNGTATPYGVHVAVCNGSSAQGWGRPVWSSTNLKLAPIGSELYNYAPYPTHKDCLVDPSGANGGTLEAVGCGSEANIQANPAYEDQVWVITTYTAASSGGGGNGGSGTAYGTRILNEAVKFNDVPYLYGGGHSGWSSFYANCLGSGKYQPYAGNGACEVDCSGLVSMATDMALGTNYDWTVEDYAMQNAGSGNWHRISLDDVEPGDIVTGSEHVEFVYSGKGAYPGISTFGAHETGQLDSRQAAGHTFIYSDAYRYE
jgi:hypothetical protein